MKIIGFSTLHYGKAYLASAIRSVIDYVDEYHIIYTPQGSYGHRTGTACPESREELAAIALEAAGSKLRWAEGTFGSEAEHRNQIYTVAPDADIIFVVDSDEIWRPELVRDVLSSTQDSPIRRWRVPMVHFWRSFNKAIIGDGQNPVRVIYPKAADIEGDLLTYYPIAHMGYAQPPAITEYKWQVHGHKNELRPEWFTDVFLANRQTDCHPVSIGLWNPVDADYKLYMPAWMSEHKYAEMSVIE